MNRAALLLLTLSAAMGCGSHEGDAPAYQGYPDACASCTRPDGSSPDSGFPSSDAEADALQPLADAAVGPLVTVDVPDAPCSQTTAARVTVMDPEPLLITYDQMGIFGARRFAFDSGTLALLTFDADGSNSSPIFYGNLLAVAPEADKLAVLSLNAASALSLELHDASAQPLGGALEITQQPTSSHRLAVGPDSIFIAWNNENRLQGDFVKPDTSATLAGFDIGASSCGVSNCKPAAAWNGRDFSLSWSRMLQDRRYKISWVPIAADGNWQFAKTIALSDDPVSLVDMVRITDGYALLVTEGFPSRDAVLVLLDDYGNVKVPAYRLLGATEGWGLANVGAELGVVVRLSDGRGAFRPLSLTGEALSPWVCLDDSAPDSGFNARVAVAAEADGYDFVVRMTDGSATSLRTDHLGMMR